MGGHVAVSAQQHLHYGGVFVGTKVAVQRVVKLTDIYVNKNRQQKDTRSERCCARIWLGICYNSAMSQRFLYSVIFLLAGVLLGPIVFVNADTELPPTEGESPTETIEAPEVVETTEVPEPVPPSSEDDISDGENTEIGIVPNSEAIEPELGIQLLENEILESDSIDTELNFFEKISSKIASLFKPTEIVTDGIVEVAVFTELDQPFVFSIPLPQSSDIVDDLTTDSSSRNPLQAMVTIITNWFSPEEEPTEENVSPADDVTNTSEATGSIEGLPADEVQPVEVINESSAEPVSWWQAFIPFAFAQEFIDDTASLEAIDSETIANVPAEPSTPSDGETEVSLEISTTSDVVTTEPVPVSLSEVRLPWLRLGTTSIEGEFTYVPGTLTAPATYELRIPPGSIPLGIHEVFVSTSTPYGDINGRFVVDVGGGAVRTYYIDDFSQYIVVVAEGGAESLWLAETGEFGSVYTAIARGSEFFPGSPLAIFEGVLFYLDGSRQSIRSFDKNAGVGTSTTIESSSSTIINVLSGAFYVTPTDTDFLFVSVAAVVY
jgi:hypothetical protein